MSSKIKFFAKMIGQGEFKLAFFSFLSGITSRLKIWPLYRVCSKNRYEMCQDYIRRRVMPNVSSQTGLNKHECNKNIPTNAVIWTMWYQGYEKAPQIVKDAIDSKKIHSNGHPVIILDHYNLKDYVSLPSYIYEKFEGGIISHAHLSDIVRVELLYRYGGIWIDSTIFLVDDVPEYVFNKEFWSLHWPREGRI